MTTIPTQSSARFALSWRPHRAAIRGTPADHQCQEVPADQVLTPIDEVAEPAPTEQPSVDQPVSGDVTADPGTVTDPIVADDGGTIVDQPVVADESVDPVITGDPVIEPAPTVDDRSCSGTESDRGSTTSRS